jgi:hypothetical protein
MFLTSRLTSNGFLISALAAIAWLGYRARDEPGVSGLLWVSLWLLVGAVLVAYRSPEFLEQGVDDGSLSGLGDAFALPLSLVMVPITCLGIAVLGATSPMRLADGTVSPVRVTDGFLSCCILTSVVLLPFSMAHAGPGIVPMAVVGLTVLGVGSAKPRNEWIPKVIVTGGLSYAIWYLYNGPNIFGIFEKVLSNPETLNAKAVETFQSSLTGTSGFSGAYAGAALAILVMTAILAMRLYQWLTVPLPRDTFSTEPPAPIPRDVWLPWRKIRIGVGALMLGSAAFEVGRLVDTARDPLDGMLAVGSTLPQLCLPYVIPVLAAATYWAATKKVDAAWSDHPVATTCWVKPPPSAVAGVGLTWALVAAPAGVMILGVPLPLALILLPPALGRLIAPFGREGITISEPTADIGDLDLSNRTAARTLLDRGPTGSWRQNVRWSVEIGGLVALVPLAFFLWGITRTGLPALQAPQQGFGLTISTSSTLVASILLEAARWAVTAAIFGLLYSYLPGKTGPTKALSLGGVWLGVSGIVELGNIIVSQGSDREWLFPGLQILLFLFMVSLAYDYVTIRLAKGGWTDLQTAYGVEGTRQAMAFVVPAVLAALAVAHQATSGTGLDFVQGAVANLPKLILPSAPLGR